jgi:hypothetical protein
LLIVPELHAIFIFPPRTGSDTLCLELMRVHHNAFLLYRHGEASMVPWGYKAWRKVGFVRHPLARLWSLYKFCAILADRENVLPELAAEVARVAASVQGKSFEEWVLTNEELFLPKDSGIPLLTQVLHRPENRKSQRAYLRPDLGTAILKFQDLAEHMRAWGLDPSVKHGATPASAVPEMTPALEKHLLHYCGWEMNFPDLAVV